MAGEKTEKPTAKRLKEGRKEGQVPRTQDLGAWVGVLVATFLVPLVGGRVADSCRELLVRVGAVAGTPTTESALALLSDGLLAAGEAALLVGAPLLVIGVAAHGAQGGLHLATKAFKPKLSRLNPLQGFKRIAGPHALWELAKSLLKTAVLGLLAWHSIAQVTPVLVASGHLPLPVVLGTALDALLSLVRGAALAGLVLAAADYAVARRRVGKQLRMSKQDIKEELRQSEGDPQLKGAIRSRQLAMSRNRMMADVATADVVLVNPTHVAVALRYDPHRGAPRVVAKGAGALAARIRAVADEHRVPMVADVPLARTLYRACELGTEIPPELYTAVARVLAFVMSLRGRGSAAGTHRLPGGPAIPTALDLSRRHRAAAARAARTAARAGASARG